MLTLLSDGVMRIGMNGILALAMYPAILCGIGPNFALSLGMLCGLLGALLALELSLTGVPAFLFASVFGVLCAVVAGVFTDRLLRRARGQEMAMLTYLGFSAVSLFSILWLLLPFHNPEMVWSLGGKGIRTTVSLEGSFAGVLDQRMTVSVFGVSFPFGGILFFLAALFLFYLFSESRLGLSMKAAGESPGYAAARGIPVLRMRLLGVILSMALGAVGILVYAQGYGYLQLYQAPLSMPFFSVAAVLLGGASTRQIRLFHVFWGTVLFQMLLTVSVPVMNRLLPMAELSDACRMVMTYGLILWVLCRNRKGGNTDA